MKKIEINILMIILTEAVFLHLFFKTNIITIILGIILGFILIYITKKIKKNKITKLILFTISIPLFIFFLYKTILFINYNFLKNYSSIIIGISLLITSIYLGNKNYHTYIKSTEIIIYLVLIIKVISLLLSVPLIKFNNFSFSYNIDYSFIYIGLFILLLFNYLYYLSNYKINYKEIILSFISPLIIKIISLLILGNNLLSIYKYPYINYLKNINYLDFIERMEGILSFEYLFCFIILLSFFIQNIKVLKKAK